MRAVARRVWWGIVAVMVALVGARGLAQASSLESRLQALRAQSKAPAVAAATFSSTGDPVTAAVGLRKAGETSAVSVDDLWHVGSITKSFTSLLVGKFVERGVLRWDATLGELLGAQRAGQFGAATLTHLLSHRAGLPADATPAMVAKMLEVADASGPPPVEVQRQRQVDLVLAGAPTAEPGTAFAYSNLGYIIAGAILEAETGKTWETLVQTEVLEPLAIASAGFGSPGEGGVLAQPRGHRPGPGGALVGVEPGPDADNPPYLGPAGRFHMTVTDLARWGQLHLRGERGQDGVVKAETFRRLHHPAPGETYAMGWLLQSAGGRQIYWHNGSNTLWYAIVAFDPAVDRGVAIVTNGGLGAGPALDAAAMALLR